MDNVTILILTNGINLITMFESLASQLGEPDIKLINPHRIINNPRKVLKEDFDVNDGCGNLDVVPWLSAFTDDKTIIIHSDKVLTSVEPNDNLLKLYKKTIKVE